MDRLLETLLRISVAYCLEIQAELVRPGIMNFGPRTSEKDSFAIMDRALELGINFFDTADVYGDAVRAAELTLDDETLNKLDEIWPGPGGKAPKAYAW